MQSQPGITELAEAVADGRPLDWASLGDAAGDDAARTAVAVLRDLAVVGELLSGLGITAGVEGPAPTSLEPGATWGGLQIVEHVGRGRFGDVYRAWEPTLDRHVALKLIPDDGDSGPDADSARVVEEGRLMARVRHPNVVAIHGATRVEGVIGLWMEFVDGRTLEAELAADGVMDAGELARVGESLAGALAAVHDAGLLHRDVKASNVLRDATGRVVLSDFGTGREAQRHDLMGGGLVGTPAYMAPEVMQGRPASARSDIYSLGVLLYHLATGGYPRIGRSLSELQTSAASETAASLRAARPSLPAGLCDLIDRALDPDPASRFESGRAMAAAFSAFRNRGGRRRRVLWACASVVVTASAAWLLGTTRGVPVVPAAAESVLLVAFENRTDAPDLAQRFQRAMQDALAATEGLTLVDRSELEDTLALMRLPPDAILDRAVGLEAARREGGVRAIAAGSADRVGNAYRLSVETLGGDGRPGGSVFAMATSPGDLDAAMARLSSQAASRLRASIEGLQMPEPLPRVETSSMEALDLYSRALRDYPPDADPAEAERLLRAAVALDPDFTMAYVLLSTTLSNRGPARQREMQEFADLAMKAAERGTDFERGVAFVREQHAAGSRGADPDQTARHYRAAAHRARELLAAYPDRAVEDGFGLLHSDLLSADERLDVFRELAEQRPDDPRVLSNAAYAAVMTGNLELGRHYLALAQPFASQAGGATNGTADVFQAFVLRFEDEWSRNNIVEAASVAEEMESFRRRLATINPSAHSRSAEAVVYKLTALGQFDRAETAASEITHAEAVRRLRTVGVLYRAERWSRLDEFLQAEGIDPRAQNYWGFTPSFIALGQLDLAREALDLAPRGLARAKPPLLPMEAELALAQGEPQQAADLLVAFLDSEEVEFPSLPLYIHLADAYLALGRPHDVIDRLEAVADLPRSPRALRGFGPFNWLSVRERLARAYRSVGMTAEASALEDELRLLLRYADEDHPIKRRLTAAPASRLRR